MTRAELEHLLRFDDPEARVDPGRLARWLAENPSEADAFPEVVTLLRLPEDEGELPVLALPRVPLWAWTAVAAAVLLVAFFLAPGRSVEEHAGPPGKGGTPAETVAVSAAPVLQSLSFSRVRILKGRRDEFRITRTRRAPDPPRLRFRTR